MKDWILEENKTHDFPALQFLWLTLKRLGLTVWTASCSVVPPCEFNGLLVLKCKWYITVCYVKQWCCKHHMVLGIEQLPNIIVISSDSSTTLRITCFWTQPISLYSKKATHSFKKRSSSWNVCYLWIIKTKEES